MKTKPSESERMKLKCSHLFSIVRASSRSRSRTNSHSHSHLTVLLKLHIVAIVLLSSTSVSVSAAASARSVTIPIDAVFDDEYPQLRSVYLRLIDDFNKLDPVSRNNIYLNVTQTTVNNANAFDLSQIFCGALSRGAYAIIGTVSNRLIEASYSLTNTFMMPFLTSSISREFTSEKQNYLISMRPAFSGALQAMVLRVYGWKNFSALYDNREALNRIKSVLEEMHSEAKRQSPQKRNKAASGVDMRFIQDMDDMYPILRSMDQHLRFSQARNIVIDVARVTDVQKLLDALQKMGMMRQEYHYVISGFALNELNFANYIHSGVRVSGFEIIEDQNAQQIVRTLIEDLRSYDSEAVDDHKPSTYDILHHEVALAVDTVRVLTDGLKQFVREGAAPKALDLSRLSTDTTELLHSINDAAENVEKCSLLYETSATNLTNSLLRGLRLQQIFTNLSFGGITGLVKLSSNGQRANASLMLKETAINSSKYLRDIAVWNEDSVGFPLASLKQNYSFRGRMVRVVTYLEEPFTRRKNKTSLVREASNPLEAREHFEGFLIDLLTEIEKIVPDFTYNLHIVHDDKYGNFDSVTGNWTGMIGELRSGMADLACAPLTINAEREKVVDFTQPYMSSGISIMIKKPEKKKPGVFSFMQPLDKYVWMWIAVSMCGITLILFIISYVSPYEWREASGDETDENGNPKLYRAFTLLNSMWFALAAFMQQSVEANPTAMSSRIIASIWWFFTVIMISYYTANLAAFLTIEQTVVPIKSVEELLHKDMIYGSSDIGSTFKFFRDNQDYPYRNIYERMKRANESGLGVFVKNTEEGIRKVQSSKGKYAFFLESAFNDYNNQKKPCDTMRVGSLLDSKGYGLATPIGSDLMEALNSAILQLHQNELIEKIRRIWWHDKGECPNDAQKESNQEELRLINLAGIFYIVVGGLVLAMLAALFECIINFKSRNKTRPVAAKPPTVQNNDLIEDSAAADHSNTAATYNYPPPPPPVRSASVGPNRNPNNTISNGSANGGNRTLPSLRTTNGISGSSNNVDKVDGAHGHSVSLSQGQRPMRRMISSGTMNSNVPFSSAPNTAAIERRNIMSAEQLIDGNGTGNGANCSPLDMRRCRVQTHSDNDEILPSPPTEVLLSDYAKPRQYTTPIASTYTTMPAHYGASDYNRKISGVGMHNVGYPTTTSLI